MSNRIRKARGQQKPPDTPLDKEQAAARFRALSGRAFRLGFVPIGITVPAATPAELEEGTARALRERGRGEPEN